MTTLEANSSESHTRLIACLDMEGVLIPELWPHIATQSGIKELAITTRDEPDYPKLMDRRIKLLRENNLRLCDVQRIAADIKLLAGASNFLADLKNEMEVIIVSDAFQEIIHPFLIKLGHPKTHCHHLTCDDGGFVSKANYTRIHGKQEVISNLHSQNYWVLAVGDAHNDLEMLRSADLGFLYRPSPATSAKGQDIYIASEYSEITSAYSKLRY